MPRYTRNPFIVARKSFLSTKTFINLKKRENKDKTGFPRQHHISVIADDWNNTCITKWRFGTWLFDFLNMINHGNKYTNI